jgi:hypothetical protein
MGIAAYQRGTLLIRKQADEQAQVVTDRMDHDEARHLARDADKLQEGINVRLEEFRYFYAAGWYREARLARSKAYYYRDLRSKIINRLKVMGYSA